MTTQATPPTDHLHFFNHHTGRPRLHFDATSDAAAAASAAAASAAASAATPWHTGVAPEVLGFWQNKGLPLDSPKDFGTKLTELYQQAEKFIGVPPDQVVRMPKADAKPEEIAAYRQRLGMPADPKDYDFSAVTDATLADALRPIFHANGVSKDAAAAVARDLVKHLDSQKTTQTTLDAGKLADQRLKLERNWGGKDSPTYNLNFITAGEGARRLGISQEAVKAMENQIGYDGVMEAMRKIGAARSEDIFVQPPPGGSGGPLAVTTREGAIARKAELMADPGWAKRFTAGDAETKREYDNLNRMILGDAA